MIDDKHIWKRGSELEKVDQLHALASFVHRYTRQHRPAWAIKAWKDGKLFPVQFDSDKEWLANSFFVVTASGRLNLRSRYCYSNPTWPDNPELRKASA